MGTDEDRILESWKEIAAYLEVTPRTAQSWETTRGLPIIRWREGGGRVRASVAELEQWKKQARTTTPANSAPSRFGNWTKRRLLLAVLLPVVLVLGVLLAYSGRRGAPARFRVENRELVVFDSEDREVWRHTFSRRFDSLQVTGVTLGRFTNDRIWFGDLDDDGETETLFTHESPREDTQSATLFCFAENGSVKWTFPVGRGVSTKAEKFTPWFNLYRIFVTEVSPDERIVVAISHHGMFYPCQVAVLSPEGEILSEYWHPGRLTEIVATDLNGDGANEILLGGVSNSYAAATLIALDPHQSGGASIENGNPDYQIADLPPASELARIIFPRSEISKIFQAYNWATRIRVLEDEIVVSVREKQGIPTLHVHYYFDRKLGFSRFDFGEYFRAQHRGYVASGVLPDPLSAADQRHMEDILVLRDNLSRAFHTRFQ